MKTPILIAMIAYMAMVVYIGVIYSKKNKTSEDYFLGGRGLGPWVTAMSAEASDMSSWLLMGLPGLAYASGFSQAGWTAIGLILGTYLNWKIVAKRLRRYTQVSNNSITVPDFFSNRFKDEKKILMFVSSIMILICFTVYTASGFAACGTLFNSVFGLNYQASMIACAAVIVIYTSIPCRQHHRPDPGAFDVLCDRHSPDRGCRGCGRRWKYCRTRKDYGRLL